MRGGEYLSKTEQYASVYNDGGAKTNTLLVMRFLANGLSQSRYGFSISRRVGIAVTRNRLKRRLRQILHQMPLKEGWDIVFIARQAAGRAKYGTLRESVFKLLSRASLVPPGEQYEAAGSAGISRN